METMRLIFTVVLVLFVLELALSRSNGDVKRVVEHSRRKDEDSVAASQILALAGLYTATHMDKLSLNWFIVNNSSTNNVNKYECYCYWYGVTCDNQGFVIALDLNNSGLVGTIPDLRLLTRLVRLQVSGNFLQGTLSGSNNNTLWQLASLQALYLSDNYLTGSIPEFPDTSRLTRLMIAGNGLSGYIPESICNLKDLALLDLSRNVGIRGTLPDCLGNLSLLTKLRIEDMGLSGTIPSGLCTIREMNGLKPNPFGCDGIGCSEGYYQRIGGRQTSPQTPCAKCLVPSNVIGNTRCYWYDAPEHETALTDINTSLGPTVTPSALQSLTPTVSTPMSAPPKVSLTLYPQARPPSLSPTLPRASLSPSMPPDVIDSSTEGEHQQRHDIVIATSIVGVASVGVVFVLFSQVRRRRKELTALQLERSCPSRGSVHSSNSSEIARIFAKVKSHVKSPAPSAPLAHGARAGILRPSSFRWPKPELTDEQDNPIYLSRPRRVRFTLPDPPSSEDRDCLSENEVDRDEDRPTYLSDPEFWASWILDPLFDATVGTCSVLDQFLPDDEVVASSASSVTSSHSSAPLLEPTSSPVLSNWQCWIEPTSLHDIRLTNHSIQRCSDLDMTSETVAFDGGPSTLEGACGFTRMRGQNLGATSTTQLDRERSDIELGHAEI